MSYPGLIAETVSFQGHNGDKGEAYYARPAGNAKVGGVVVVMHMPGWDEWIIETTRKITHHGFAAISPHLTSAKAPAARTISAPACARRAACLTIRWSATSPERWRICAHNPTPTARSA